MDCECKLAAALSRLEMLYVEFCAALSKPRASSGNLALTVQDLLPELAAILQTVLSAPSRYPEHRRIASRSTRCSLSVVLAVVESRPGVAPSGREGATYVGFEQFFGLRRERGALSVGTQRLPLVRTFLRVAGEHEKGNRILLDPLQFKAALVSCVAGRLYESLVLLFQMLSKLRKVMVQPKDILLADAIKVSQ